MEQAFAKRAADTRKFSNKEWMKFDIGEQEVIYQKLYNTLLATASGIDELKEKDKIAKIFEKFIWKYWLLKTASMTRVFGEAARGRTEKTEKSETLPAIGVEIERRLNAIGISSEAHIKLSGHWYEGDARLAGNNACWNGHTCIPTRIRVAEVYVPPPKTKQGEQAA